MTDIIYNKVLRQVLGVLPFYLFTFLPSNAQRLQVDKPIINVGKTGYEIPVTATFELKNKGRSHLTISSVKPDCGCTHVDYPKKSIGSGDVFTISMTYDARMLGHFTKQAAVYVKGNEKPVWLTMKGVVLTDWVDYSKIYPYAFGDLLADQNNVEFDDVNKGDNPEVVIKVVNNGETSMQPNVLHLPPYLTASTTPETLQPGKQGKVTLTFNSQNLHDFGLTQTSVYLASNLGDKVSTDIELPVSVVLLPNTSSLTGNVKAPRLQLSTDSLTLGMQGGKLQKSGTVVITNNGQMPLSISSLQMFTKGMTVTLGKRSLQPDESTKLKVTIDHNQVLSARQKPRVLMITNDPNRSKVVIKVNVK